MSDIDIAASADQPAAVTTAPAEADDQVFAEGQVRHNLFSLVLLDSTYTVGTTDLYPILAPLMVFLAASNAWIGFVTGGATSLALVGIILSPWITRRFRYKKWYFFWVNVPCFAMFGLMGVCLVFQKHWQLSQVQLLRVVIGGTVLQWLFAGFCSLPCQEYTAACIPSSHRGRLLGYSFSIGGIGAMGAAIVAQRIMTNVSKPECFGYVFIIGWFICQAGFLTALMAKERPTPVEKAPPPWSKEMMLSVLKDKSYMKNLGLGLIPTLTYGPAWGFIAVYGYKDLGLALSAAATIQIVQRAVTMGLSSPIGHFVDKFGPKHVIPHVHLMLTVTLLPVIFFHNQYAVYVSLALLSIASLVSTTANNAFTYAVPPPEHRAAYFTCGALFNYGLGAIGPIFFGLIADRVPYRTLFIISAILSLAYWRLMVWAFPRLWPDSRQMY